MAPITSVRAACCEVIQNNPAATVAVTASTAALVVPFPPLVLATAAVSALCPPRPKSPYAGTFDQVTIFDGGHTSRAVVTIDTAGNVKRDGRTWGKLKDGVLSRDNGAGTPFSSKIYLSKDKQTLVETPFYRVGTNEFRAEFTFGGEQGALSVFLNPDGTAYFKASGPDPFEGAGTWAKKGDRLHIVPPLGRPDVEAKLIDGDVLAYWGTMSRR